MAEKDVIHVFDKRKEGQFGGGVSDGFYTESKIMVGETGITVVRPNPIPKRIVFNRPATIVFWNDGTKTVVKCGDQDVWDEEKGVAMAFTKKMLGNKFNYYDRLHGWIKKAKKASKD